MIKQTRLRKVVTAIGLLCLFGQGCASKSVRPSHPLAAGLKSPSKAPRNPYKRVKPAEMSKYMEMVYRSSQANRIRTLGGEPAADMSLEAGKIAARIEQEPENLELPKQLARVLIREGQLVKAFETLDRIRSFPATDPEIEAGLGLVWQKLGSTTSALYHVQQALLLDPSPVNLALLGKIHLQRADYGKAVEALTEAYASYPDSQSLVLALARASAGVHDWEAARTFFERALELDSGSVSAREGLATALVRLGEVDSALAELRRLFEEGEAYARLGEELMAAESWGEAQKALEKALRSAPKSQELALKLAIAGSHLPFPTIVYLDPGDGIAIDVQNIAVHSFHGVVELRGAQVLVATAEPEPGIEADRTSSVVGGSPVVNLSPMDSSAEPGPYRSEFPEKKSFQRFISPSVVELGELPRESRDPVVSLAESGLASPVNLPVSESLLAGLPEASDIAAAWGRGSAELAQIPLSGDFQVIQLVNGTVVASNQNAESDSAQQAVADLTPTGSQSAVYQSESRPEAVMAVLEAWGIPAQEVPEEIAVAGRLSDPVFGGGTVDPFKEEETVVAGLVPDQVSLPTVESFLDEHGISQSAAAEIVKVKVDIADKDLTSPLETEMTEAGNPLQPDLLCRPQDSTSTSRAILAVDSLMEEDFRREEWALRSELNTGVGVHSYAGTIGEQPSLPWLPLAGLAALSLLAFLRRRRQPVALVLERDSGKH